MNININNRSGSKSVLIFSCAILTIAAIQATAQQAPKTDPKTAEKEDEEVYELSPFQVSGKEDDGYFKKNTMVGTRSSERIFNIPQGIQIITSQLMQDIPTDNTVEILKYGSSGINKRTNILGDMFMRGFRVRTFLKDNVSFAGNINVPLYDVDRIEVVKGPAALVFGQSSATGGLINYVTKTPTEVFRADVKGTIGTFDFMRVEANASGPVGNSGLGYRGTFATTKSDGPGKFDYNDDLFLGTTLLYKLTRSSSVQFDYSFSHKDEIVAARGVGANGTLISLPDDFTYFEPWVYGRSWYHFASLTVRSTITPNFQIQVVANYNKGNNDWDRVTPIGRPDPVTGLLQRNFQELFFHDRAVNQLTDFLHSYKAAQFDHKLSFGWIATSGKSGPNPVSTVRIADINIFNPVYNTPRPSYTRPPGSIGHSLTASGYIQEQLTFFSGKLILVGGYRYNRFHSTSLALTNNVTTERNDQAPVKRYGAVYKPLDWLSVYYNYSESFVFNTGLYVGGPNDGNRLLPSFGVNDEIGVKVETADGHLFGSIAYYDLSLTNVRLLYSLPVGSVDRFGVLIPGALGIGQDGKETNKGAYEADIGLSFESPLGPWQAILTLYRGDQLNSLKARPNSVVNDTWSILVNQEWSKGSLKGLKVGLAAFNRGDCPGVGPAVNTTGWYTQPGYTTTAAFFNYTRGHFRFALNVDNISDKKDMIEGGEDAFWLYVNPGRTFKFSVDYRY